VNPDATSLIFNRTIYGFHGFEMYYSKKLQDVVISSQALMNVRFPEEHKALDTFWDYYDLLHENHTTVLMQTLDLK